MHPAFRSNAELDAEMGAQELPVWERYPSVRYTLGYQELLRDRRRRAKRGKLHTRESNPEPSR